MRPNLANEVKPANHPFRGIRIAASGLALALAAACFQPAGNSLEPTSVDLAEVTRIAPAATLAPSPTPFITPLPPEGFIPPTLPPEVTATFLPTETSLPMADLYSPTPTLSFGDSSALTPSPETPLLPPTPTALPTDNPCIHTVQPGEWMNKIARQYNISLQDLIAANPQFAGRADSLQPGDQLRIPNCNPAGVQIPPTASVPEIQPTAPAPILAATVDPSQLPTPIPLSDRIYTVVAGDTLGAIARKFGITVQQLREANNLGDDFIRVGQQLRIPLPQN
ncbi:MAG: hypothetical protein OHK0023_08680 [Anaerolineae bacterium]